MKRWPAVAALCAFPVAVAAAQHAGTLSVAHAWSRPAAAIGVTYLTVVNAGATPQRIVGGSTPVAGAVEFHETTQGNAAMDGMEMSGVMSMHPVASVVVPAHGSVTFRPGGYHFMLTSLRHELRAGESFPFRVHFANGAWSNATVHVTAN